MSSNELDRDAIRARAEAATPGPWVHNPINGVHTTTGTCVATSHRHVDTFRRADAAHIAGMDPATTIALLDALDAAETENERLRGREQHAIEYERRLTWDTTCGKCADHLDASIKEYERAERYVQVIANVRDALNSSAMFPSHRNDILAILDAPLPEATDEAGTEQKAPVWADKRLVVPSSPGICVHNVSTTRGFWCSACMALDAGRATEGGGQG